MPRTTSSGAAPTGARTRAAGRTEVLRPRGRPPKYGRPSQVVAVTLPQQVVETLGRLHTDLGWAIVSLVERTRRAASADSRDVQLVEVGDNQFLIVVNAAIFRTLPGVQIVPLSAEQAFLALAPGRGMTDLELAVRDRLEKLKGQSRERRAMTLLGDRLKEWRRDPRLRPESRSIIIVSRQQRAAP